VSSGKRRKLRQEAAPPESQISDNEGAGRATAVYFYRTRRGVPEVREWLIALRKKDRVGFRLCLYRIRLLQQLGPALSRPRNGYLGDGIYELRADQYRILYTFVETGVAIL